MLNNILSLCVSLVTFGNSSLLVHVLTSRDGPNVSLKALCHLTECNQKGNAFIVHVYRNRVELN